MAYLLNLLSMLLLVSLAAQARTGEGQLAQENQSRLAQQLSSGSDNQRAEAVKSILHIPPDQRASFLLPALVQELDRLRQQHERRRVLLSSGQALAPAHDSSEYLFEVLEAVSSSDDLTALEALVPFIGTGNRVINAVAAFGEPAVPSVSAMARSDHPDTSMAIVTLQRMIERSVRFPLTPTSRQLIVETAKSRLTDVQKPADIQAALGLAVSSGDPGLRQRVQEIMANERDVQNLGILDARTIRAIQNEAARALSLRGPR